jgi:hypothetical protein
MILPQIVGSVLFPNDNIPEVDKLKPEFGLRCARAFWEEIEREAAKLEVTVDYYLAEFY